MRFFSLLVLIFSVKALGADLVVSADEVTWNQIGPSTRIESLSAGGKFDGESALEINSLAGVGCIVTKKVASEAGFSLGELMTLLSQPRTALKCRLKKGHVRLAASFEISSQH